MPADAWGSPEPGAPEPMPSTPPDGEPVPPDGALPRTVAEGARQRAFGVYVHVPFCRVRCGYCDFNTYTSSELGGGADQASYATTALAELDLAGKVLDAAGVPARPASTGFFGGGAPALLPPRDLAALPGRGPERVGLAPGTQGVTPA